MTLLTTGLISVMQTGLQFTLNFFAISYTYTKIPQQVNIKYKVPSLKLSGEGKKLKSYYTSQVLNDKT